MDEVNPRLTVQKVLIDDNALRMQVPFAMSISGPQQSGKSEFVLQLIEHREKLFSSKFVRIIYCQSELLAHNNNGYFERLKTFFPNAELNNGLPNISKLNLDMNTLPCLIILDDLMTELLDSPQMVDLLAVQVHHFNLSTIFTLQNYFAPSKFGKTIMRNVNYKVYFYNRLDLRELRNISCQIVPNSPLFMQANFLFLYKKFPEDPSHYILVDGHFRNKIPSLFVRSRIFPQANGEIKPIIFFPNPDFNNRKN
jgi:hypothetical protein